MKLGGATVVRRGMAGVVAGRREGLPIIAERAAWRRKEKETEGESE
jgi:hypothetical protein